MNLFNNKKITIALLLFFIFMIMSIGSSHAAPSSTFLHPCLNPGQRPADITESTNKPYYCTYLGGSALKQPLDVNFDTASNAFSIPMDCLNLSAVTVIQPNARDQWGNPAEIVAGQIALDRYDQATQQYTDVASVKNFQFYALKNVSCKAGFKNFGAAASLLDLHFSGGKSYCVGSFFNFYSTNSAINPPAYLISTANNDFLKLPTTTLSQDGFHFNLTKTILPSCGGQPNVISYDNPVTTNSTPSVPGFAMKINNIDVPLTTSAASYSGKIGMLDTGGGMVIISDDKRQTIVNVLNKIQTLASPSFCPSNISWLQHCSCLPAGIPIEVINTAANIDYLYLSTDANSSENQALAICPPWQANSPNPYIEPNGMNLGYEFFQHVDMGLDYQQGNIYLRQNAN